MNNYWLLFAVSSLGGCVREPFLVATDDETGNELPNSGESSANSDDGDSSTTSTNDSSWASDGSSTSTDNTSDTTTGPSDDSSTGESDSNSDDDDSPLDLCIAESEERLQETAAKCLELDRRCEREACQAYRLAQHWNRVGACYYEHVPDESAELERLGQLEADEHARGECLTLRDTAAAAESRECTADEIESCAS